MKINMNSKIKILIGILVVGIILIISGYWFINTKFSKKGNTEGITITVQPIVSKQVLGIDVTINNNLNETIYLQYPHSPILEKKRKMNG